jgi:hypothetical protein
MAITTDSMIASSRLPDAGNRCRTAFACGRSGAVSHAFPEVIVAWFIGQSLVFILLAFVLGVIAGRLSRWPSKNAVPAAETVAVIDDELERIEGVGPAMANALRAAGIRTFEQLAESGDDAKRNAIRTAGLHFAPSLVTWGRQARLLADGDEAAFTELVTRLIAGRDTTGPAATQHPATAQPATAQPGTPQAGGAQPTGKPRPRPRPRPADRDNVHAATDSSPKAGGNPEAGGDPKAGGNPEAGNDATVRADDKAGTR